MSPSAAVAGLLGFAFVAFVAAFGRRKDLLDSPDPSNGDQL